MRKVVGTTLKRLGFDRVLVGGRRIKVSVDPVNWAAQEKPANKMLLGLFDEAGLSIAMDPEQPDESLQLVLCHELCHVLMYLAGGLQRRTVNDEWIADIMGGGLAQIMRDNPALVEFLKRSS